MLNFVVPAKPGEDSMVQNKMKIKNDKIMLEASFLRKSTLKTCETCVNLVMKHSDLHESRASSITG